MANLPATVVCTGCGSWLQIDVENSGGTALVGMSVVTVALAFFWPIMLAFLPLYFVMSMGRLQSFTVELLEEPKAELWTISRKTGEIRKLEASDDERIDVNLSKKFATIGPREPNVFRAKAQKYKALRARLVERGNAVTGSASRADSPPQLSL